MPETIKFNLNRKSVEVSTDPDRRLLWVLRTDLGLTGAKFGCGQGHCGSCTVLVGGRAARSCILPVRRVEGKDVVTIEGLAENGKLHPVQQAFMEHDALQCGFCTPGMILEAVSLLREKPNPTDDEVRQGMNGNLCRCGAHQRIIRAIQAAAKEMR